MHLRGVWSRVVRAALADVCRVANDVNCGGRGTAQERVTGGRWRRIVLVDVLAEHIVELRGRARVWPWR